MEVTLVPETKTMVIVLEEFEEIGEPSPPQDYTALKVYLKDFRLLKHYLEVSGKSRQQFFIEANDGIKVSMNINKKYYAYTRIKKYEKYKDFVKYKGKMYVHKNIYPTQ
jgi:hypothetical protein